jgi:hypothetical protein
MDAVDPKPEPAPQRTPERRPDRTLIVVIAVVAVIVVIALVVVFTRGGSAPLDESTPSGVVQRYTEAVIEGDDAAAREYLADGLADDCERVQTGGLDDVRVVLVAATERGDTATVAVSVVTSGGGGLFGPSEYRSDETFGLVRDGTGWAIDRAPWQFAVCAEVAR